MILKRRKLPQVGKQALEGGEHTPETEEYGISSFVFRSQKPFHPECFWNYLNDNHPSGVIRSKGLFWLFSRPNNAINFGKAGGSSRVEKAVVCWASLSYKERTNYQSFADNQQYIESKWDKKWGDRMNELVFIVQDLEKDKMISELEGCLLNEREESIYAARNNGFRDPFPKEI
jgi:G3E family GTPase